METMSVTKAVVSLLVGRAITLGYIQDVDSPVSFWFSEWRQGQKRHITLRQVLTHTSGLQNVPLATQEIYPSSDLLQLALCAEIADPPGKQFAYNNKAVNLLIGVLERATNQKADQFAAEQLFSPLGIENWWWQKDAAGNPHGMSGLQLCPLDLARLGQLALDDGQINGAVLIDPAWMKLSTSPATTATDSIGLLWWLLPAWTQYSVTETHLRNAQGASIDTQQRQALGAMLGTYPNSSALMARLQATGFVPALLAPGTQWIDAAKGPQVGFRHDGWLGQHLVIHREARMVGVRLIDAEHPKAGTPESAFEDFVDQFVQLASLAPQE